MDELVEEGVAKDREESEVGGVSLPERPLNHGEALPNSRCNPHPLLGWQFGNIRTEGAIRAW